MENAILQDYQIFNYIYNDGQRKTKQKRKEDELEFEPSRPVIKYPKTSKIEIFRKSLKFKEEDSELYVKKRLSDAVRQEHKKKDKTHSAEARQFSLLNNNMF